MQPRLVLVASQHLYPLQERLEINLGPSKYLYERVSSLKQHSVAPEQPSQTNQRHDFTRIMELAIQLSKRLSPLPKRNSNRCFLCIPPEVRIVIYQYLLPTKVPASAYKGLRRTCRLVRSEYDHEAGRGVAKAWVQYVDAMATFDIDILSSFSDSVSSSTLELVLPRWLLNATDDFPAGLIPWQWSWLTHANIHIDASDVHHYLYSLQDTMQKLDNHIHRNTFQASEGFQTLPLDPRTTIEQVDFLWYNFPPHLVIPNYTYWWRVRRVCRRIEQFNACWYTARVRDEDGVVFGMRGAGDA
jgi:hypothetical protein